MICLHKHPESLEGIELATLQSNSPKHYHLVYRDNRYIYFQINFLPTLRAPKEILVRTYYHPLLTMKLNLRHILHYNSRIFS